MKLDDYAPAILAVLLVPLTIAFAVLLPALIAMIAINCILDIHYPGHHVGYGEAYAISYLLGLIGSDKTVKMPDEKGKK